MNTVQSDNTSAVSGCAVSITVQETSAPRAPSIIVKGTTLTEAQAMTVRVALTGMNFDCGDDEHGKRMEALYRARCAEVLHLMVPA